MDADDVLGGHRASTSSSRPRRRRASSRRRDGARTERSRRARAHANLARRVLGVAGETDDGRARRGVGDESVVIVVVIGIVVIGIGIGRDADDGRQRGARRGRCFDRCVDSTRTRARRRI